MSERVAKADVTVQLNPACQNRSYFVCHFHLEFAANFSKKIENRTLKKSISHMDLKRPEKLKCPVTWV